MVGPTTIVGLHKLIKTLQSTQNNTKAEIEMSLYGRIIYCFESYD
jgi:hypothetical protein